MHESITIAKFENSELEFDGYLADQFAQSWNKIRYAKYFELKPKIDNILMETKHLIAKRDRAHYEFGYDVEMFNVIINSNLRRVESMQTKYLHSDILVYNMAMRFLAKNDFKKQNNVWVKCTWADEI